MWSCGGQLSECLRELPGGAWLPAELLQVGGNAKKKGLCSFKSAVEGLMCKYALAGNK